MVAIDEIIGEVKDKLSLLNTKNNQHKLLLDGQEVILDINKSLPVIKSNGNRFWEFAIADKDSSSYCLGVGLNDDNEPLKFFLFPKEDISSKSKVSINIDSAHKSKYSKFMVK